ncbi:MAG: zinc-ribbon domain-containing protein [Eubacterium sp.]
MKCSHCGKTIPEDAKFCSYCAEPVSQTLSENDRIWNERDLERKAKSKAALDKLPKVFAINLILGVCVFLMLFLLQGTIIDISPGIAIVLSIGIVVLLTITGYIYCRIRLSDRDIVKYKQFVTDKTSICPMCGSHSVKIYRKGYNWNEAFWGSVFKIKGSRYIAGMESNTAMCHCEHCGHRWNSGYDFRTIK